VEPYPAFYAKVAGLAAELSRRLGALEVPTKDPQLRHLGSSRDRQRTFFDAFSKTARRLEELAKKELAAIPFTNEEAMFLKRTINIHGGGSGPPDYSGWYPQLIYGGDPTLWEPTIADVHTNAQHGKALEVGVGNVSFLVVAIDNQSDRAVYVGPAYSYYEFEVPATARLTDETWQAMLTDGKAPARPAWTSAFRPPAVPRDLGRPKH
jgi:hypothetical protein